MRTLVVHTGGIGDFILTCPAIRALGEKSTITLAGSTDRLALAVGAGLAECAVSLDSIDFHSLFSAPTERLISFAQTFDEIIVWMRDDDRLIEQTLSEITPAFTRVFPGLPSHDWNSHASHYYTHCLNLPPPSEIFPLTIPQESIAHDVIIHAGSGSRKKNWPLERFQELADALAEDTRDVIWCVGPTEIEQMPELQTHEVLQCKSLSILARHLSGANLFIGNDSGVTHLAAVLGTRTISIFGPTNPDIWAPIGPCVDVINQDGWPSTTDVVNIMENATGRDSLYFK